MPSPEPSHPRAHLHSPPPPSGQESSAVRNGDGTAPPPPFDTNPNRAQSFFERTKNTSYPPSARLYYWLAGIQADCTNARELRSFLVFAKGLELSNQDYRDAIAPLEIIKPPVAKYVRSLGELAREPKSYAAAFMALRNASTLRLEESVEALGEYTLQALNDSTDWAAKKRGHYLKLVEVLRTHKLVDLAVATVKNLEKLLPEDTVVTDLHKQVAAEHALVTQRLGEEGGFRRNIRDPQRQAQLELEGRTVHSEQSLADQLGALEREYATSPEDSLVVERYVKLLRLRETPETLEKAVEVLDRAYERGRSATHRRQAAELRIRLLEARLESSKLGDHAMGSDSLRAQICAVKLAEWAERVREEPQNALVRLQYGEFLLEQGNPLEALKHLQLVREGEHVAASCEGQLRAYADLQWWREFHTLLGRALSIEKGLGKSYTRVVSLVVDRIGSLIGDARPNSNESATDSESNRRCAREIVAELITRDAGNRDLLDLRRKLYS